MSQSILVNILLFASNCRFMMYVPFADHLWPMALNVYHGGVHKMKSSKAELRSGFLQGKVRFANV